MPRSGLVIVATIFVLFVGGTFVGSSVGGWLGRNQSDLAMGLGMFSLPISFGLCMIAWYWVGMAWMMLLLSRLLFWFLRYGKEEAMARARRDTQGPQPMVNPVPGTALFPLISTLVCTAFGVAIGLTPSAPFLRSVGVMMLLGLVYGWILHRLARAGYLIPPESV
jgi:hypothetical protein